MKILAVIGTRPEAIKMAPLLRLFKRQRFFQARLCVTGQHGDLLSQTLETLGLKADENLRLPWKGGHPSYLLKRVVKAASTVLRRSPYDLVLVQGDTTSALGAALAASRSGIPVGHIEAGLRSFDLNRPFPEEGNRLRIDGISRLLFAPNHQARKNLLREGISPERIFVTGNTGIDALLWAKRRPGRWSGFPALNPEGKFAVVTLHRRESFGRPLRSALIGLTKAAGEIDGFSWIFPLHPNPEVRRAAEKFLKHPRIKLVEPLDYPDFVHLMEKAHFLVTDSGGIQEEAPSLGKRVLILRDTTERRQLLARGGRLIGARAGGLPRQARRLAQMDPLPARSDNPFGDGKASARIVNALLYWAGLRKSRPADWGGAP